MHVHIHIYKGVEYRIIIDDGPVITNYRVITSQRNVRVIFRPQNAARFTARAILSKEEVEDIANSPRTAESLCMFALNQFNRWVYHRRKQNKAKH